MKERPIIYNTENVRAILDGRKTQTRRTKGLKEVNKDLNSWLVSSLALLGNYKFLNTSHCEVKYIKCPYGRAGDRLWARETWAVDSLWDNAKPSLVSDLASVWYPSTASLMNIPMWVGKMRPSIFMPKWASRITLEITEVRVERLQEISQIDAIKEGIQIPVAECEYREDGSQYIEFFSQLWDSINGKKHPWESNPWVWMLSFRKINT